MIWAVHNVNISTLTSFDKALDQLNISYPDTVPTVKAIWDVFTPWFKSKVLEIGADEYSDDSLSA